VLFSYTSCAGLARTHLNHPNDEKEHSEVMRMIILWLMPMLPLNITNQKMPVDVRLDGRLPHFLPFPAVIKNRCIGTDPLGISPRIDSVGQ
jgi:hypothetical protein